MIKILIVFILLFCMSPSYGEPSNTLIGQELERVLQCDHEFKPGKIIKFLQKEGVIDRKPIFDGDGIPSYRVQRPILVYGLNIKIVEGWSYEGAMFSRGSGTAPPIHILVGFEDDATDKVNEVLPKSETKNFKGKEFSEGFRFTSDSNYSRKVGKSYKGYPSITCSLN